jgi:hypothetical protein
MNGKVALVSNTEPITGSSDPDVVDFVGYGSSADDSETSPAQSLSDDYDNSLMRVNNGCTDRDNNSNDFGKVDVSPRNTSSATNSCPCSALTVWLNEFHYEDDRSPDVGEFIEVAGTAGTDLTSFSIVLYNGDGTSIYSTLSLSGTIPNQSNDFGTLSFSKSPIQNGPDGLALVNNSNSVIQFLSYKGSFTASDGAASGMTSTDVGVLENNSTPAGQSLQRIGTGNCLEDLTWSRPSSESPGAMNAGQTPLAVTLATFTAETTAAHQVLLRWQTVLELDNLGFNLYRSTTPDDPPSSPFTPQLIPSQAPGSGQGAAVHRQRYRAGNHLLLLAQRYRDKRLRDASPAD